MLRARKKRGAEIAPRPISQFAPRWHFHPSFVTSIRPPALPRTEGEHNLSLGVAVYLTSSLHRKRLIAESEAPHCWPLPRSLFPTAKCNPGQRDRRAALTEFSALSLPPPAQARGETVGHIWFPQPPAQRNNRFPQIVLSRTTGTLRGPFLLAPHENPIRHSPVSQLLPCSRVGPSSAPPSGADHSQKTRCRTD